MSGTFLHFVRGFLMGCADVVPGVSGATVALVVGIYRRLVKNIRAGAGGLGSMVRLRWRDGFRTLGEVEWAFLAPLLAGILTALVSLARLLEGLLEDHPVELAGLFFGLVAASVWVAATLIQTRRGLHAPLAITAAVGAWFLMGVRGGEATDPATWIFFAAGGVAIVAMILPGISGSFLLVTIGMYEATLAAVNDRAFDKLVFFALGAVISLAIFSHLLHWALESHHDLVMAAIVGLLVGSLRVLWPWPNGLDGPENELPALSDAWLPALLALAGAGIILVLTLVARERAPEGAEV
jgi:putative membrane protein